MMIICNAGEKRWKLANMNQVGNPVVPLNLSSYSTNVGAAGPISLPRGELGPGKPLFVLTDAAICFWDKPCSQ